MAMLSSEDVAMEAPDVTATEEHQALAFWLESAIRAIVPEPSAVIGATFMVAETGKMVPADILVSIGSEPGGRNSWRLPRDPVPDVLIEIISRSNFTAEGRRLVDEKRALYGAIGVPEYLELDPSAGTIDVYVSRDRELVRVATGLRRYLSTRLYGLAIAADDDNRLVPYRPNGERFPLPHEALAAVEGLEAARAQMAARDAELAERDAELARLRALLAERGIDPEG